MGPKRSSSPASTRKRTSAAAGYPPDARENEKESSKDTAAKESARAYIDSLKKGKKVEESPPPPPDKKSRRRSTGTPPMPEEEEKEVAPTRRSRRSSIGPTSTTMEAAESTPKRSKSPPASRRGTKIAETVAAVAAAAAAVSPLPSRKTTPGKSPIKREPSPTPKRARSPSPARAVPPVKPSPPAAAEPAALARRASSPAAPSRRESLSPKPTPKVVIVSAATAMRRKSLSPVRGSAAASTGSGTSPYTGMASGSSSPRASAPKSPSSAESRAIEKAKALLGSPSTTPSSSSSRSPLGGTGRGTGGSGGRYDVPVEIVMIPPPVPTERASRGVRFTDGGSPGQPPAEEELNLTEEEMRVRTAALEMLHPPEWVEYIDGIAVLVVLLTGFLVTSESARADVGNMLAAPTRFFSLAPYSGSGTQGGGGFSATPFILVGAVVYWLVSSGASNYLMGKAGLTPNSAAEAQIDAASAAAVAAPVAPASPVPVTSPVKSGPTAGILRNTERRLSAGHTPAKALLERGASSRDRSLSPAPTSFRQVAAAAPVVVETPVPVTLQEQLVQKAGGRAVCSIMLLVLLLLLVSFFTYPSWTCLYNLVAAFAVGGALVAWKRFESSSRRAKMVSVLARVVKEELRSRYAGKSHPTDFIYAELEEHCQDKKWPAGTDRFVKDLTEGELKSNWSAVLVAVKEDKRVVATDDTSLGGMKLEHLKFIGDTTRRQPISARTSNLDRSISPPRSASSGSSSSSYSYAPKTGVAAASSSSSNFSATWK